MSIASVPAAPGVKEMVAEPFPAEATRSVGGDGTTPGVTVTGADAVPLPMTLIARSWIEYVVPSVSEGIVRGPLVTEGLIAVQFVPSRVYS